MEYTLNFLGTTGCGKWNQWTLAGVSTDDTAATKKTAKSFLDYLASQMDDTVSPKMLNISIGRCANLAWRDPR